MSALDEVIDTTATLSAIVPQLFFDLIARIIPGFAIIWSFYLALLGGPLLNVNDVFDKVHSLLSETETNSFFIFSITVLVFYTSSIIFYGFWSLSIHAYFFLQEKLFKCEDSDSRRFIEVIQADEDFTLRLDFIKLRAPVAGNRITKLKAEIHMSGTLTATFGVCFLFSLVGFFDSSFSSGELLDIFPK